ncbi:MAG: cupin domain-containing protein [Roseiflexaceae bacterium]
MSELPRGFALAAGEAKAITLGEETITATPGASVYIPPGVVHTFFNPTAEPVKFLVWLTPGDFAGYFEELFALFHSEAAPAGFCT